MLIIYVYSFPLIDLLIDYIFLILHRSSTLLINNNHTGTTNTQPTHLNHQHNTSIYRRGFLRPVGLWQLAHSLRTTIKQAGIGSGYCRYILCSAR